MAGKVYVVHENPEWTPVLLKELSELGVPYEEMDMSKIVNIDMTSPPPAGVFYSRMSASSHTRGNAGAVEMARAYLAYLERNGRKVFNGSHVLELELSKAAQASAFHAAGIPTPPTVVLGARFGAEDVLAAARKLGFPCLVKPNRGGKGIDVEKFEDEEELSKFLAAGGLGRLQSSIDGIILLQEYIVAPEPFITRLEFIDHSLHYAMKSNTEAGAFQLCPSDGCKLPSKEEREDAARRQALLFSARKDIDESDELVKKLISFSREHGVNVCGAEFIVDREGNRFVYDLNCTTNYSSGVEKAEGINGQRKVAEMLRAALNNSL